MNENYKNFDGKDSVDVVKNWPYELFPANTSKIREKQMKKVIFERRPVYSFKRKTTSIDKRKDSSKKLKTNK